MDRQENRNKSPDAAAGPRDSGYEMMREGDPIDERLLDEGDRSPEGIEAAAEESFVRDQRDPQHPSRVEREFDVEDPSHSQGI